MGYKAWPARLVAVGCIVLVGAILANNAALASDPYVGRSWGAPVVSDDATTFAVTFQTREGDRLSIDVRWSLGGMLHPDLESIHVSLYETQAEHRPGHAEMELTRSYNAVVVDGPSGFVLEPPAPIWEVVARSWYIYEVQLRHGDFEPGYGQSWETWAEARMQRFVSGGSGAPEWSGYQRIPAGVLALQPFFYGAQFVAFACVVVGGALTLRDRTVPATGVEGGLRFADQARRWLGALHGLLLLNVVAVAGVAFLVYGVASADRVWIHSGLYPDAFYVWWMPTALGVGFVAGLVGLVAMLVRVRRAMNAIPELALDE